MDVFNQYFEFKNVRLAFIGYLMRQKHEKSKTYTCNDSRQSVERNVALYRSLHARIQIKSAARGCPEIQFASQGIVRDEIGHEMRLDQEKEHAVRQSDMSRSMCTCELAKSLEFQSNSNPASTDVTRFAISLFFHVEIQMHIISFR